MAQQSVSITPGQKYKFIVKSAEEAASIIREKLGETAQVISVRQVEGEGLARFLKSPKLEIIAQVPGEQPASLPHPPLSLRSRCNPRPRTTNFPRKPPSAARPHAPANRAVRKNPSATSRISFRSRL
jgi:flagellar biosynthesis GTPase FlhF